jgi:uncharacterized membrane protein YwzB
MRSPALKVPEYYWHDLVGNIGVVLIVASYLLLQTGRIDAHGVRFSAANAAGAMLIMISLYFNFNLSSFIIECVWLAVSIYGLRRARR